jgi:RND family efflux transporter MFP subunit
MKQFSIFIAIISLSLLASFALIRNKKIPDRQSKKEKLLQVEVRALKAELIPLEISAFGSVQAESSTLIVPDVAGKVIWVNPHFKEGDYLEKDEILFKIDPSQYKKELAEARAHLARTERELAEALAEGERARYDWEKNKVLKFKGNKPSELVLHKPHIREARAALQAAKAQVAFATLNLERSAFKAPFKGRISKKSLDLGQYLSVLQSYGALYSLDSAHAHVPLSGKQWKWLQLFDSARIILSSDPENVHRGKLIRSLGQVDPESRLSTAVIEIENGFTGKNALKINDYVKVEIQARPLKNVFRIERHLLEDHHVWVLGQDHRLQHLPVDVIKSEKDFFFVRGNLEGKFLVLSALLMPHENMKVAVFTAP